MPLKTFENSSIKTLDGRIVIENEGWHIDNTGRGRMLLNGRPDEHPILRVGGIYNLETPGGKIRKVRVGEILQTPMATSHHTEIHFRILSE